MDGLRGLLLHLMLAALLQLALLGQMVTGHATTNGADNAMMAGVVTGDTARDGARQTTDGLGLRSESNASEESSRDDQ